MFRCKSLANPSNRKFPIKPLAVILVSVVLTPVCVGSRTGPSGQEVLAALRNAAEFYVSKVANNGGYHYIYSSDLKYGRSSKGGKGPTQISATTSASVGLGFLSAWEATNDSYYLEAARAAAYALIKGQMCTGGWDYNIELDPQKRNHYRYRVDVDCLSEVPDARNNMTNLDNNNTQAVLRMLMHIDRALDFEDKKIHKAVCYALDSLIRAQYPNGAWPQRYDKFHDPNKFPVKPANYPKSWSRSWPGYIFYSHYTFNDDVIVNMIDVMLEAAMVYREPGYGVSAEKVGGFIILAQMPDPQPAWAQQYDVRMHPAWARSCEPPAITSRESLSVMKGLISLYRQTGKVKYLEPIPRALDYLKRSAWVRDGKLVMARFYELRTNRPLYITKGTRIYGPRSAGHISKETGLPHHGYEVTYSDKNIINHYSLIIGAEGLDDIREEYERAVKVGAVTSIQPDIPEDSSIPPTASELAVKVRDVISSMDSRGAWTQMGNIGGSESLIWIMPAKDLLVRFGEKLLTLKEDEVLEVYNGTEEPSRQIISSGTFAANIRLLSNYLAALDQ